MRTSARPIPLPARRRRAAFAEREDALALGGGHPRPSSSTVIVTARGCESVALTSTRPPRGRA
jgi:hypothetical protein